MRCPSKIRAALVTIAIFTATTARAEPPHLEAPPDLKDCPSAAELRRAIAARLGRDDFDRADSPSVSVRVRRATDGSLSADLSVTTSSTSTRTIDNADSCVDLVQAAALSVALAIEHDAPAPPPPPSVQVPILPKDEGPIEEAPIRADRVVVGASALTAIGLSPQPAVGAGIHARFRVGRTVWLSARGLWLPASEMPNSDFRMRFIAGGAGACVEPLATTNAALMGCGHLVGGAFGVISAHTPLRDDSSQPYIGVSASLGARTRIAGPVSLEGAIDGELPFTHPTFLTATCPARGFEPPFLALGIRLGASIAFR